MSVGTPKVEHKTEHKTTSSLKCCSRSLNNFAKVSNCMAAPNSFHRNTHYYPQNSNFDNRPFHFIWFSPFFYGRPEGLPLFIAFDSFHAFPTIFVLCPILFLPRMRT